MKTILITGGAGFIGSHLAERLCRDGHYIVSIDNMDPYYSSELKQANIGRLSSFDHFQFHQMDIRDEEALGELFESCSFDVVVHLAAKVGVRPSLDAPEEYFDVNVQGTLGILECMRAHDVKKFVFASSSSVYGNTRQTPFHESQDVNYPVSPYAASKKSGELLGYTYHHLYQFDVYCLRFFTVYGPRQRPEMAIALFTDHILKGEPIHLFGDGSSARDYTYIEDIIEGVSAAIERVRNYEIINLGGSDDIRLIELVRTIEDLTNRQANIEYLPFQAGDVERTYADISKANELLHYNPKTPIREGLKKYVHWKENKSTQNDPAD